MMFSFKQQKNKDTEQGFTLIELMVAVAIFAIVLLFAMGSIITIIDANRKARTLTSVMNNVNFAFENMTRTIKTGRDIVADGGGGCTDGGTVPANGRITVNAIDPTTVDTFDRVDIIFRLCVRDGKGVIEKKIGTADYDQITSNEVDIDRLFFRLASPKGEAGGLEVPEDEQPRVLTIISGSVEYVRNVRSEFNIQTTVSQRDLNT